GPLLAIAAFATTCMRPPDPNAPSPESASEEADASSRSASVPSQPYEWKSVVIMGGGFVTGLLYSPVEAGILYARTDIGGAYRYDPKGRSWIPVTDFIGHENANLLGIESFAVDPGRADRVYLAAGMYTADWAPTGAFMRSDD